jgi:hypothetical protein
LPLQSKPNPEPNYSSSDEGFENNLEINDLEIGDDLLPDPEDCPETDESSLASLDDYDPHEPDPVALVADWLIEVRELVQRRGPFSAEQIAQIVRELSAPADGSGR